LYGHTVGPEGYCNLLQTLGSVARTALFRMIEPKFLFDPRLEIVLVLCDVYFRAAHTIPPFMPLIGRCGLDHGVLDNHVRTSLSYVPMQLPFLPLV
jgi:hypothetical protein